jgi:predicted Zn-dependent peptidase
LLQKKLAQGVDLNVIPTNKFKTVTISFDFITEANYQDFAKRALLAELWEISNLRYPSQSKLSRKLSAMYGASFGTNVLRYGNLAVLRITLSIPNPKYVDTTDNLLEEAIQFLYNVIFQPLVDEVGFDLNTFNLQKTNMQKYIQSLGDDKQYYSGLKLKQLFFKDNPSRGKPLLGNNSQYNKLNRTIEYEYYQRVIKNDNIFISVLGDVNESDLISQFSQFPFNNRSIQYLIKPLNHFNLNYKIQTETISSSQSYLNMGYRIPICYNDDMFIPAVLFNALLGGTPQSKLFKNVREKNSLAYYASSTYNSINGFIMISTGIDSQNQDQVIEIVKDQINEIANGKIDLEVLNNIKSEMINGKKAILDSSRQVIEETFVDNLLNRQVDFSIWMEQINAVTVEQIMTVAEKVRLSSILFLGGQA